MGFHFSFSIGSKKPEPVVTQEAKVVHEPAANPDQFEATYGEMIRQLFKEENEKYLKLPLPPNGQNSEMPIAAGRVSQYEGGRNFMISENAPVPTTFDFNNLKLLANYGMYNRHVSMAVENIVSLGNTDYDIDFGDTIKEKQANEMKKFLASQVKNWYEFADGEESLDNDLLVQCATYGCISAEAVIMPNLKGISKIVRVDPFYIRFAHNKKTDNHIPLQIVGGAIAAGSKYPGYIQLNTATYQYIAMRRMGEMPYAVPPFLSALEDIFTEADMIKNFQNMMRRLGMLGFLSVLLKAPQQNTLGETPDQYRARLSTYLESVRGPIERGFSRGIVIGYEGTHNFELTGANLNTANAEAGMKIIKSLVFSGLKQDPNMHGENYSTTETFGRVILEKFTAQVANFQKPVATLKGRVFELALLLAGYRVPEVNVTYHTPSTHDQVRAQEVISQKTNNLKTHYDQGLIDQHQFARGLGYDKPAHPEPRKSHEQKLAEKTATMKSKSKKASNSLERIKKKLKSIPEFDYTIPEGCEVISLDTSEDIDAVILAIIINYLHSIQGIYSLAINSSFARLVNDFSKLSSATTLSQIQETLIVGLFDDWEHTFLPKLDKTIEKNVSKIYSKFRRDGGIFSGIEAPSAKLNLFDARAIDFIEAIDKAYLGKFVGDPDTQNRIKNWVKTQFDAGKIPLNGEKKDIKSFLNDFSEIVEHESWKIDRIINTSTAMARNIASVNYLNQAGVTSFEVHEVMDKATCRYCQHMDGMKFSVKLAVEQFDELFTEGITGLEKLKPFATKFKIDEFTKLDNVTLQSLGIALPPFHNHCRGWIVNSHN